VQKLENLNNLLRQDLGIETIIHDLQMLLQLRFFEINFDESLTFIDPISSPLVDTGMRNPFGADDVKLEARKSTLRSATTEDPPHGLRAHSS